MPFLSSFTSLNPTTDHILSNGTSQKRKSLTGTTEKPTKRARGRFSSIFALGSLVGVGISSVQGNGESRSQPIPIPSTPKGPRSMPISPSVSKSPPTCTISLENATSRGPLESLDTNVNVIPFPSSSATISPPSSPTKHSRSRSNHLLLRKSSPLKTRHPSKGHRRHRSCTSVSEIIGNVPGQSYERPTSPVTVPYDGTDDDDDQVVIDLPSFMGLDLPSPSASHIRRRGDAKLVAMVKRSILAGVRETSYAALRANVSSSVDSSCTLVSSTSSSGSVTYDFLEDLSQDTLHDRQDMMDQDRILIHRLNAYLHEWGWREKRVLPEFPTFRACAEIDLETEEDKENKNSMPSQHQAFVAALAGGGDVFGDDDAMMDVDMDMDMDDLPVVRIAKSSERSSTPPPPSFPERRPSPPPPAPPRVERTLGLDQLVATLTLRHRDRLGAHKGGWKAERKMGSGLRIELSLD